MVKQCNLSKSIHTNSAICFIILHFIFLFFLYSKGFPYTSFEDYSTVGIQTGYSAIVGYYSDSINNGTNTSVFSFFPINVYFMFNILLAYNRFSLVYSNKSFLQIFGISTIPSLYYTLPYAITIYTGAGLCLQYYSLSAIKTKAYDSTTKAGFVSTTGIAKLLFQRTFIIAECMYHISELSHKNFQTVTLSLKAGYQFALHQPEYYIAKEKKKAVKHEKQIEHFFNCGLESMHKKDHVHALYCFNQILSLKPDHKESLQNVTAIMQAKEQYESALALIQSGKDFDALPLLASSSQYIAEATIDYKNVQYKLKPQIPELQQKAIEAFNNKSYDACITIMNTVLLIDPDNTVAKGYIVRSKRIKETIQKLQ